MYIIMEGDLCLNIPTHPGLIEFRDALSYGSPWQTLASSLRLMPPPPLQESSSRYVRTSATGAVCLTGYRECAMASVFGDGIANEGIAKAKAPMKTVAEELEVQNIIFEDWNKISDDSMKEEWLSSGVLSESVNNSCRDSWKRIRRLAVVFVVQDSRILQATSRTLIEAFLSWYFRCTSDRRS